MATRDREAYQGYPNVNPRYYEPPSVSKPPRPPRPPGPCKPQDSYQGYPYVKPIVTDAPSMPSCSGQHIPPKRPVVAQDSSDDDEPPVIYIDIPEDNRPYTVNDRVTDTGNNQPYEATVDIEPDNPTNERPTDQVEAVDSPETIFYDPFENRRIIPKEVATNVNSSERLEAVRPLEVTQAGMSKESQVYGRQPDDGFSFTPIPVSEFPEPPPAYSELPNTTVSVEQTNTSYPRTQVITNECYDRVASGAVVRKQVVCQHCGTQVHTLVLKQVGPATHAIALSWLLCCFVPATILIYLSDWFRYHNHYCPSCSKLVGYEIPMLCHKLVYVATE
ncbi:unnamed protein product [Plutella xylostella]|uniref:(diamondback moth) hypothetical protein n=1 Tax=Plutella xylostella TaxID=51655 RepID=A0A8S4EWA8_PLUXY|nr:unnamed protein product [Plutella xylostella]